MDYRNNDLGKIFDKKYTVNKNTSRQISEDQLALFDTVKQAVEAIYNYIQFSTLKVSMQS